MPKPICVPCQRFFRPEKTGFSFIEGMPDGDNVPPGNSQPELWMPYKLWRGDLWKCQGCGTQIVVGFGGGAIAEHFQPDFNEEVKRHNATFQVNDC